MRSLPCPRNDESGAHDVDVDSARTLPAWRLANTRMPVLLSHCFHHSLITKVGFHYFPLKVEIRAIRRCIVVQLSNKTSVSTTPRD